MPGTAAEAAGGEVSRRVVSPVLVGRARERDLLTSAVSTPPAVVLIEGEAGIGKTRLISELRPSPGDAGHRLAVGACHRIRDPLPLAPVLDAIGALTGQLAGATLSPLVGALRPLLPEASHLLPPALAPLEDRAAERHRVFRALAEVLDAAGPLALVLDDLHWADDQTVDFLSYLLASPPAGLALVLTFRGEEVAPPVRTLAAKLPAAVTRAHLALSPLDDQDTGALAAAILGVARVEPAFATHLWERTSGVPFAVEEVLALLRQRLRGTEGSAADLLGEVGVPEGIRDSTLERVSRLPEDARALVDAAAVLQAPGSLATLEEMLGMPAPRVVRALGEAAGCGLLTDRDGTVGFRHLLAAQAVYDAILPTRRREWHDQAASVLERQDPVPLGQLAHQLRSAGRLREWAAVAERAAAQAVALGHDAEAVRLLVEVLRDAPLAVADRGRLAVAMARAATDTARPPPAVPDLMTEVLARDLPRPVRGELRFRLALLRERGGAGPERLRPLLADAVGDLDDRPDLQAWAMIGLGLPVVPGVPLSEYRAWLHRASEILPRVTDRGSEVLLLGKIAMVFAGVGDPTWRRLAERMVERTAAAGRPPRRREANAFLSVGIEACHAGHLAAADRLLARGRDAAGAHDSEKLELGAGAALALLDYYRGEWHVLADRVEALVAPRADHAFFHSNAEVVAGCLALARGDLDRARQRLTGATERLARHGALDVLPVAATAMIRLALGRGDAPEAAAVARRLLATLEPVPFLVPALRALPPVTEALTAAGSLEQAGALVRRWGRAAGPLDAPLAAAALRHAHGLLYAARGEPARAGRELAAAATHYDRLPCPYEAAQAREHAARVRLEAGDHGDPAGGPAGDGTGDPADHDTGGGTGTGAAALRAALAAYTRLGATWDLARAARTARRHGVPVPAQYRGGSRGYGSELSPRERTVAELAAEGRTNKEIAAELFVSPETVKAHLRAVMRKLGVHSRVALSRRLSGRRQDRPAMFTPFG